MHAMKGEVHVHTYQSAGISGGDGRRWRGLGGGLNLCGGDSRAGPGAEGTRALVDIEHLLLSGRQSRRSARAE